MRRSRNCLLSESCRLNLDGILSERLRFLLDTNILIPLQDSMIVLEPSLANFVRLAGVGGHQLLYHPASKIDIERDKDFQRKTRTLKRLQQYTMLEGAPASPHNTSQTSANDACDNDILHALECSAVHALVTEDKEIHAKARQSGFSDRVYNIQTAEDWLRRLHEPAEVYLPNIEDVPLYSLTNQLDSVLFDRRRTVYSQKEIEGMATTPTKVMLFRLAGHFTSPISYSSLIQERIVSGPIQSITRISDDSFFRLLELSQR